MIDKFSVGYYPILYLKSSIWIGLVISAEEPMPVGADN